MNTNKYSDRDWATLASALSDENYNESDLPEGTRFAEDQSIAKHWAKLREMEDDNKEINVGKAWNKLQVRLSGIDRMAETDNSKFKINRNFLARIAAVALILIGVGSAAIYFGKSLIPANEFLFVTNDNQKNLKVTLPDGSNVYLNRNTELSYKRDFGKNGRLVSLNGEAYFEIIPEYDNPFIVDADNAKIKVMGTSFNVITDNTDSSVEVFVNDGKVMLSDRSGKRSLMLDPGFIGTIDTKVAGKIINNDPNYMSWKTGLLIYNGQKLDVVFKDLKRVYNMNIIADDKEILENLWTSPIDNLTQETIIRLICTSFNLSYTKDGTVYHLTKK